MYIKHAIVLETASLTAIGDGMVGMFQDIILPEVISTTNPNQNTKIMYMQCFMTLKCSFGGLANR